MLVLFAALLSVGIEPGPMDGFRANYAKIRAEGKYTHRTFVLNPHDLREGTLWQKRDLAIAAEPRRTLVGTWALDGTTEYYCVLASDNNGGKAEQTPKPARASPHERVYVPNFEALYDGETLAEHRLGEPLAIGITSEPGIIRKGKGAFLWWGLCPFYRFIDLRYHGIAPKRCRATVGGHRLDCEVFEKHGSKFTAYVEVCYDPAVGFLPRYMRQLTIENTGTTWVQEFYLLETVHCRSGGFVPVEWIESTYKTVDKVDLTRGHDLQPWISPSNSPTVGHFKIDHLIDITGPVALRHLEGVDSAGTSHGLRKLPRNATHLTLPQLKSHFGRAITDPPRARYDNMDREELRKYSAQGVTSFWRFFYLGLLIAAILASAGLLCARLRRFHRSKSMNTAVFCLVCLSLAGWGTNHNAPVHKHAMVLGGEIPVGSNEI